MNKSEKQYNDWYENNYPKIGVSYNDWYENNYPKIGVSYNVGNKVPYKNPTEQLNLRLSVLEYEKLKASSKKTGLSKSEYLRKLINENYED